MALSWRNARAASVGAPTSGRSFRGTGLATFGARSRLPQMGAACTAFRGRPDPGAKLFGPRVGAVRRGSRLPQDKGCHSHKVAPCTYCFSWEARPWGEAFRAPSWRRSPRVAPPAGQSVPLAESGAMHLLLFVGGPTPGRSFSGAELTPFAAGRASHRQSEPLAQSGAMHLLFLWEARPRGEAFRAPSWRRSPRVALPTDSGH